MPVLNKPLNGVVAVGAIIYLVLQYVAKSKRSRQMHLNATELGMVTVLRVYLRNRRDLQP